MVFPVVMYGCEIWTIKKAERRRIDAFELWCWRRLESTLDWREIQSVYPKGNQSWIFIGKTDVETETPILWPPDLKSWFIWKDPDAGKDWRRVEKVTTGWGGWMASPPQCTWVWACSRNWWWTGKSGVQQSMGSQRVRYNWVTELNWKVSVGLVLFSWGFSQMGIVPMPAVDWRKQVSRTASWCLTDIGFW